MEGRTTLTRGDVALPAVLTLAGFAEAAVSDVNVPVAMAVSVAAGALLCGRRRWPVVTSVGACFLLVLQTRLGVPEDQLVAPLAMIFTACFALGRYAARFDGVVGLVLVNLMVPLSERVDLPRAQDVLWVLLLTAGPWLAGRLMGEHARRGEELARQSRQLVLEQRQLGERLVADERRRIAREMHDIIAHSISVMVVQAGAASDLLRRDPDAAERAVAEIQSAGRAALDETGRLLRLLREDGGSELDPQPAAADLPGLVEVFRSAGLDVTLVVEGSTDGLPAGVDLSVFRIVQEGLTNALKHAPGSRTVVTLHRRADGIEVDLQNAAGSAAGPPPSGRGLVGMRERVAVFGGALDAGPTEEGGYRLHARLPLPTE
ncbi:sensor histidine kinase [Mumia quercus]|uniref:sensor histidine kinase n=1 Tax=Mumia quercus TaxID=2976125 RepID=UPI0021D3C57A|nr:histidine kinase [Mumia quercus]